MTRRLRAFGFATVVFLVSLSAASAATTSGRHAGWWPEGKRPPYATLPRTAASDPHAVLLQAAEFDAPAGLGADAAITDLIPVVLRGAEPVRGGWLLVQFAPELTTDERDALLAKHHALAGDTIPNHVRVARVPAGEVAALANEAGVTWVGRYHPAYKLSRLLGADAAGAAPPRSATGAATPWRVDLRLASDADPRAVADAVRALGASVVETAAGLVRTEFIDAGLLPRFARLDEVTFVEETPYTTLYNDQVRWILQSGTPGVFSIHAHGVRGSSQTLAIMDSGLQATHCCFTATGKIKGNKAYGGGTLGAECNPDHGTHTSGTLVCSNGGDHDGMAPDSGIIMQDIGKGGTDCIFGAIHPPSPLSTAWDDARTAGARVHSNSWGGGGNAYGSDTQAMDQYMWTNQDFLLVFAAGNAGPGAGSLGIYSNAKNSITVGATGNGASADNNVASFSSMGPAGDGRTLPDLLAPGDGVSSSYNKSTCGWTTESGTSMATPGIAGSAGLVRDYFVRGFYPSGAANAGNALQPSAALVKAVLLASTRNVTGAFSGGDRPNADQGFGRVTLDDALWFTGDAANQRLVVLDDHSTATGFVAPGASDTFTLHLQQAGPVKVMLVWTDAPGSPAASKELVNDLDLDVTTPDGKHFTGNQGFSGGSTVAQSTAHDTLNNKEAVFLDAVVQGDVTVKVTASVLGNASSAHPQDYALVALAPANPSCTGALPTGVGNSVTHARAGSNLVATWADRGADHYVVYRGNVPSFYGQGVPPFADNVHDGNAGTPGVQWTDAGAVTDGQNHYYLYSSANACGDVVP